MSNAPEPQRKGPKPALGRIVHYRHHDGRTYPALINRIFANEGFVNLFVFTMPPRQAELAVEDPDGKIDGTWSWPPRE